MYSIQENSKPKILPQRKMRFSAHAQPRISTQGLTEGVFLVLCGHLVDSHYFMSKDPQKPTGEEALAILEAAQKAGHLPEGFIEEQLAVVRGEIHSETHTRVEEVGQVQEKRELTPAEIEAAVSLLKTRSQTEKNKNLCPSLNWERAERALRSTPAALRTVIEAEQKGHEPTIYFSDETGFDIGTRSGETPASTRDCVFDKKVEQWYEENYPKIKFNGNAKDQAMAMGWQLMRVKQGKHIAENTPSYYERGWSWYETDDSIRETDVELALRGSRDGAHVSAIWGSTRGHDGSGGWRGSLRVNFVN